MKNRMFIAALVAAAGTANAQWSDDFNRPNGPIGGSWNVISGTWGVLANQGTHQSPGVTGVNEVIQHSSASLTYDVSVSKLDVFCTGTALQFSGFFIGLGGSEAILVKLQAQTANGQFSNIGFYSRTTGAAWTGTTTFPGGGTSSAGFFFIPAGLTFASGRLSVTFPTPDVLQLDIDTDFNGVADQTYTRSGVSTISAGFGTGHGIGAWGSTATFDNWSIATIGGGTCYANCDASTNPPCLNVNDFVCFNNQFAAASSLANCDASTNPPILGVNDFICFNNKYASGCSNLCAAP